MIELEDRTVRLTGNVEDQYDQWREPLADIYAVELAALEPPTASANDPLTTPDTQDSWKIKRSPFRDHLRTCTGYRRMDKTATRGDASRTVIVGGAIGIGLLLFVFFILPEMVSPDAVDSQALR